jgi:hypothetical protein
VNDRLLTRITPRISTTCARRSLSPCNSQANCDGSWAEPLWKTAHRRIPPEAGHLGYRRCTEADLTASPSGLRFPPLVPGLFWFRARVILLTADPTPRNEPPSQPQTKLPAETRLPLHSTRPKQPLAVPEQTLPFPHPEPPLLLVLLGIAPSSSPDRGSNRGASPVSPWAPRARACRATLTDGDGAFLWTGTIVVSNGLPHEQMLRAL